MRRPCFAGLGSAALLLTASLTPSLVPRHWAFQGVVSGIVTAAGYAVGTMVSHLWRSLEHEEPSVDVKRVAWGALAVLAPAIIVLAAVLGVGWQRQLRTLMGMAPPRGWSYPLALVVGVLLAAALVVAARGVRWVARRVSRVLARWLPAPVARVLGGVLVALLGIGLLDGVVDEVFFAAADQTFRLSDQLLDDDPPPTTSRWRSGGPGSLVAWEDLGSQGRHFIADGPAADHVAAFSGGPPIEPIRVYAGLSSQEDSSRRAELVVEELERTGAFDRAVLCVMTPTGTGWIDPHAAESLEYLWGGDTALATMQYSYLPSPLSFLVDASRVRRSAALLFDAVHARWEALPAGQRPRLVVFGESLGVDGSEAAFSGLADIRNRTDGALWVGPPNFSELWSALTARRDRGSPERLPIYDGGATVRFAGTRADLEESDKPWNEPRVVYLQHASDPVVWWSPRLILRRPDWLAEPRGSDVLPTMRWFPLVTFLQVTADMANADHVPAGHGHAYGSLVADAWAAIVPPPDWSAQDTDRLRAALAP